MSEEDGGHQQLYQYILKARISLLTSYFENFGKVYQLAWLGLITISKRMQVHN